MKLHRQLGISYNATWRKKHKLMQVMMERDDSQPLSGFVGLDDAYMGGERAGVGPKVKHRYTIQQTKLNKIKGNKPSNVTFINVK
ncbi:MAG: hypothetical protein ACI9Y1_002001 [Lentisphaeria bacterium]|jgi:hypothetical protein